MVDPPAYSSDRLKLLGIPSILIVAVIISHCHADHDAGAFHKILDNQTIEVKILFYILAHHNKHDYELFFEKIRSYFSDADLNAKNSFQF